MVQSRLEQEFLAECRKREVLGLRAISIEEFKCSPVVIYAQRRDEALFKRSLPFAVHVDAAKPQFEIGGDRSKGVSPDMLDALNKVTQRAFAGLALYVTAPNPIIEGLRQSAGELGTPPIRAKVEQSPANPNEAMFVRDRPDLPDGSRCGVLGCGQYIPPSGMREERLCAACYALLEQHQAREVRDSVLLAANKVTP